MKHGKAGRVSVAIHLPGNTIQIPFSQAMTDLELEDWAKDLEMLQERNRIIRLTHWLKAMERDITSAEEDEYQVLRGMLDLIKSAVGN